MSSYHFEQRAYER